ncbi:MAG: hypothetical protein HPY59_17990 [Anaerolineae bacterium]|nr:hypothetical protein [Anaerolineae bacterium]
MKYRVIDQTIASISQGDFTSVVENGTIELPDELARDFLQLGMIAPLNTEYKEGADDGLHQPDQRQARSRKQSNHR